MLTRTKYSGKVPLVVGAALAAAVLMALLPLAGCDTNSGSGGTTTTQQSGTGTGGTGGNTGTSGGGTSTGGGTTGSGTGDNVGTGPSQPATPATYTVTFNANGGSEVASQTVESGKTASKPTDPTRHSDKFLGWYGDSALTKEYDFAAAVTADITLYAKWQVAAADANRQAVVVADGTRSEHDTLAAALTTASGSADSTVYLVQDITLTAPVNIPNGSSFTLDLNGRKVSSGSLPLMNIEQGASLTVTDSSGLSSSLVSDSNNVVVNNGTLTVSGGNLSSGTAPAVNNTGGTMTMDGGNITSGGSATTVNNSGTMTVKGGTISATGTGVINSGTLTVNGGSISSAASNAVSNYGTMTVTGGTISSSWSDTGALCIQNNAAATLIVKGGSIEGQEFGVVNYGAMTVAGGSISSGLNYAVAGGSGGTLKLSGNPVITGGSGNPGLSLLSPITLTGALTGDTAYSVDFQPGSTVAQSDGTYVITAADAQKFFFYQDANVKGTLSGTGTDATVVFP